MTLLLAPIEGTPYVGGNAPGFQSVSAAGLQVLVKSNLTATSDPTSSDDSNSGYRVGSRWINTITGKVWEAVSVATLAAVWKDLTATTPPAGIGTELQIRGSATAFGALTGSSSANGGIALASQAIGAVPLSVTLASGQTADALQVTSYNGTAGDTFYVASTTRGCRLGAAGTSTANTPELLFDRIYGNVGVQLKSLDYPSVVLGYDLQSGGPGVGLGHIGGIFWSSSGDARLAKDTYLTRNNAGGGGLLLNAAAGNPLTLQANGTTHAAFTSAGVLEFNGGGRLAMTGTPSFFATGGELKFGVNGGATSWSINNGHWIPNTFDNTFDIGNGSLRPRSIYAGTSILIPAGSASVPGLTFAGNTNTGLYSSGTNTVNICGGASNLFRITAGSLLLDNTWSGGGFTFGLGTAGAGNADRAGNSLIIASGKGTGSGSASTISFQTSTVLASGTTEQSLSTRLTIDGTGQLIIAEAGNLAFGTTTGTKFGTATTQKMGWWNATPIVQPSAAEQVALINNTAGSYDGTLEALPDPTDSPASADELRDYIANTLLPALRNNFTDIYTLGAAARAAQVNSGLMKGAA